MEKVAIFDLAHGLDNCIYNLCIITIQPVSFFRFLDLLGKLNALVLAIMSMTLLEREALALAVLYAFSGC